MRESASLAAIDNPPTAPRGLSVTPANQAAADHQPTIELTPEAARIIGLYLERVAVRIETISASPACASAFRTTVKLIRDAKPE